jgi:invasion protein IalB
MALVAVGTAAGTANAKLSAQFQQTTVQRGQAAVVMVTLPYASPLRAGLVLKSDAWRAERGNATLVRAVTSIAPLVIVKPLTGAVHRSTRVSISTTGFARGTYLLVLQQQRRDGKWLSYVPALFVPHRAPVTLRIS